MATRPNLILTCTPGKGHVNPISTIAKALIHAGYPLTVVSSTHYQPLFESLGALYVAVKGYGDYWDDDRETKWPERALLPPGSPEQFAFTIEHSFVRVIPDQLAAVQRAISQLRQKSPSVPIVVLNESAFLGALPLTRPGTRGPRPDGMIGIGINPVSLSSVDTAPFGAGLPPPGSEEKREEYKNMRRHINATFFAGPQAVMDEILEGLGAEKTTDKEEEEEEEGMCPPSMMYPRSDAPASFMYAGGLPRLSSAPRQEQEELPEWWQSDVVENAPRNKIVFVCQGTVVFDYSALVLPTIEAMRDRPQTLVVVVLGRRGATLWDDPSPGEKLADNIRVVDYLPYDAILPLADVFVGNGGYGGVIHSVSHGTPMVLAGETEDKTEMCAIAAWAGTAVNLKSGRPSVESLRAGIEEVLTDKKYKETCERIKKEMEGYDPVQVIGENVDALVAAVGFDCV